MFFSLRAERYRSTTALFPLANRLARSDGFWKEDEDAWSLVRHFFIKKHNNCVREGEFLYKNAEVCVGVCVGVWVCVGVCGCVGD